MRLPLALALIVTSACLAQAQQQEGVLVNRLLRPNVSLANSEQNKKFAADRVGVDKRAQVGTFYLERKSASKSYSNTRDFRAGQLDSHSFDSSGSGRSLLASRSATQVRPYATTAARVPVQSLDQHKPIDSTSFSGNRPFLEKGKSQKSLDRKTTPMTIEQVRELLNKNK